MVKWEEAGYLKEVGNIDKFPSMINYTDLSQDLNLRALSYLDIMTFRMETNQVGAAMPEIGRVSIHKEGLQLIKDWINEMDTEKYN